MNDMSKKPEKMTKAQALVKLMKEAGFSCLTCKHYDTRPLLDLDATFGLPECGLLQPFTKVGVLPNFICTRHTKETNR